MRQMSAFAWRAGRSYLRAWTDLTCGIRAVPGIGSGQESWRQVRRLLMEWDLIGVAGVPEAADEYDCMIGPLLHRLFEGADTRALFDWISQERPSHFGAGPDDVQDTRLAESLTT